MPDKTTQLSTSSHAIRNPQVILRPKEPSEALKPEYVLKSFPAAIGRHPANDLEIPLDSVSRYHARIEHEKDELRLVDLKSSNGTYINGERVMIAPVHDHDTVAFGSVEFTLIIQDAPPDENEGELADSSSVHFMQQDDRAQNVYHAELPEGNSSASVSVSSEEITDAAQLKRAQQQLRCFYRLHEILNSSTDEERLLQLAMDLLFDVLPVDRGVMLTRTVNDPAMFRPLVIKTRGRSAPENIGISKTMLQRCLKERVAILTCDARQDERFMEAESVMMHKIRSAMCVPLISGSHIFGFIHLDTTETIRSFSQEDLAFLANVGVEIAIHLHNLRMLQERILSERMAAIGQTITGMAHNIKNILVLSQGGMEMMEKRLHDKNYDALEEMWGLVRRGQDRIHKLVQDMLDYSRARTVEKARIDINEFMQDLCETFADEMIHRGIECRLELDEKCPPLMLDGDGLTKALENLVLNAMEACGEKGNVIILRTTMNDEGNLLVEVEDSGSGIPKEILPRVFVPFFTTKGSKGSGLGLAMTKKFIEDMGGRIDVKSEAGVGTRFTITIFVEPAAYRFASETGGKLR